jgi:glycosyltransferase involved in cell wall biosynthesis
MADMPLVSILTPSFNQIDFVLDCLDSVCRQTHKPLEHIVVDAGSTDGTLELLRSRADDDLQVLVRPGTSQAEAVNIALEASAGSIIGWLNTDDAYLGVDAVAAAVAAFSRDLEGVVAYGNGVIAGENGSILRYVRTSARLERRRETSPLVQPAVFIRRGVLAHRFLRPDLQLTLDYELWLWLRTRGRFVKVNRALAIDRDHGGRKMRAQTGVLRDERVRIWTEYGLRPALPRPIVLCGRWLQRVAGLAPLLRLERDYEFAFTGRLDGRWPRVTRQLLRTQASLFPPHTSQQR